MKRCLDDSVFILVRFNFVVVKLTFHPPNNPWTLSSHCIHNPDNVARFKSWNVSLPEENENDFLLFQPQAVLFHFQSRPDLQYAQRYSRKNTI